MNNSAALALNQDSAGFGRLIELFSQPAVTLGSGGLVTGQNTAFQRWVEVHPELPSSLARQITLCLGNENGDRFEVKVIGGRGSITVERHFQFVRVGAEGPYAWIGVATDEEARLSQIHAARLQALGEMASGIAHEINNPLTVILAKSHLLEQRFSQCELADRETLQKTMQKIQVQALRINKVVRGLRKFSRDDTHDPMQSVNLAEIAEECLSLCAERMKAHGIRLYSKIPAEQVMTSGREAQISQILTNLLNNAFDAVTDVPLAEVHFELHVTENEFVFRVRDSGPGVPEDLVAKIMTPFFTTKPVGVGTGLGLSISLGLARLHGGDLRLNRTLHPSCFEFSMPKIASNTKESSR